MMRKKHSNWKFISLLLVTILLASCAGQATPSQQPLRVSYTNWWGDYTLVVAKEKGFFDKYGVEVEPTYYEVFSAARADLASGKIDAGTYIIGDALAINSETDLTVVAISDDGGVNAIVVKPEISSVTDLRGKRIGVLLGSAYELLVTEMLKTANIEPSSVVLVNTDAENVPAGLAEGRLDAGFTWEPYITQAISQNNRIIFSSNQISGLYANVIAFRAAVAQQRPEDIKNFLKAWFEAVNFRNNHPAEANQIIAEKFKIPLEEVTGDAKILTLDDNKSLFSKTPGGNTRSIYELAQLNSDFLIRLGSMNKSPDFDRLFDASYLGK